MILAGTQGKEKKMTDIFTQDIKDLIKLATTDFNEFYKQTEKEHKSSGYSSTAASSGDYSTAASSGYYSTAASSGDSSTAVSSGNYSKAASSGYYSKAASSGNSSKAASSGYYSTAASSGDYSKAASSGNSSTAVSSGDYSKAASSGDYSTAVSSGDYSTAASSGDYSKAASSGNSSTAASSGYYSTAASSGDSSTAVSSGNYSKAASSGYYSKAASSGNSSTAASSGDYSACSALGYRAAVKGDMGNLLMASEYARKDDKLIPVGGKADIVDGKLLKPDCWYIVEGGEWVEVDYTDGLFHRVLSTRGNVRKLKNDEGDIVYLVTDNGKSAHGSTIKKARENLIYKIGDRDKSEYEGLKLNSKHTVPELIEMYRVITGACEYGVKAFIENQEKVKDKYTIKEIIALTEGQYGHDQFKKFFKG
jgi:hypothetical protein